MNSALNIPVIGSGSIGTRHHQNLQSLNVRSELFSFRQNGMAGLTQLLRDAEIDGVVIATATPIRLQVIRLCAAHNLPMYIEKPLCVTAAQVKEIFELCSAPLAAKSMVGFMMRYHPLIQRLCEHGVDDVYRFDLVIGHDVTQWRQNWSFAQSYAADPQGGGVLLDLCHELDLAKLLFPSASITSVSSIGHSDYPQVDFATQVSLTGDNGVLGSVSMDYLAPVSTRQIALYGRESLTTVDMNTLQYRRDQGDSVRADTITFERNDMFIDAMQDFLLLISGSTASEYCPRLDLVHDHCALIAHAWESRFFTGLLDHQIS